MHGNLEAARLRIAYVALEKPALQSECAAVGAAARHRWVIHESRPIHLLNGTGHREAPMVMYRAGAFRGED
jgi:hypothetical protein